MKLPEAPERGQPGIDFLQGLGPEPVETPLSIDGGFDESGVAQNAEMLRDGWLRHAQAALDLSNGLLGGDEQIEDGATVRFGDDVEDRFHASDITRSVYTCQGIYKKRFETCDGEARGLLREHDVEDVVPGAQVVAPGEGDGGGEDAQLQLCAGIEEPLMGAKGSSRIGDGSDVE